MRARRLLSRFPVAGVRSRSAFATGLLVVGLSGCSDTLTESRAPEIEAVEVVDGGSIFRSVDVQLAAPGPVRVEYDAEGEPLLRVDADSASIEHRIFLPRLVAETDYTFTVAPLGAGADAVDPRTGGFRTGSLPPLLDAIEMEATGSPTFELLMLEFRNLVGVEGERRFHGMAAVDGRGRIVWFHDTEEDATQGWHRRSNGNLMIVTFERGLIEMRPDGEEVARLPQGGDRPIHHDVIAGPDGTVLFITLDRQMVNDTLEVTGDAIWEWDPRSGVAEKRWTVFDFFDWEEHQTAMTRQDDWTHANSLHLGPRDNVLISLRFLHQVVSIAPDFQSIEWRLGGADSSFELEPEAEFRAQHTASEIEPGRVLLFDNGTDLEPGKEISRAAEIEYDLADSTATLAWEFRPAQDNFSFAVSSAFRLDNGNTVTTFGFPDGIRSSFGGVKAYESDPAGNELWVLDILGPGTQFVYRGTPMSSMGGETVVAR